MEILNNKECFVQLWLQLEHTRQLLEEQHKRFCIRRVLKDWFGSLATDDFIWEVYNLCEQEGLNELPPPSLHAHTHRELLRAITAIYLGIGIRKVNIKALDAAYYIAFPKSKRINVNKK